MALDEALMESVRAGGAPVLRFYRWEPACLSLGRNQPAAGRYDEEAIAELGLEVVRRPTGGRAVIHKRELTYSVVVDDRTLGGPRASYRAINAALAAGLRRLGVPAELQAPAGSSAAPPSALPCFESPAAGELVVRGRKLVGSAQWRHGGVLLQHGSLLLHDDQRLLDRLTREPAPVTSTPAVLAEILSPLPSWTEMTAALAAGWAEVMGAAPEPSRPTPEELDRGRELRLKHQDPEWIWRR